MALSWPDPDHDTIEAENTAALREWFEQHHETVDAVWIRYWKKGSGRPSVTWSEVVDELLCFGWIDTLAQSIDDDSYVQYLTHRRAGSTWSKVNKAKVEQLEAAGRMTDAGRAVIDRARADWSWTRLDATEALIVPDVLAAAFDEHPGSREFYDGLADSLKRAVLGRIYLSKRPATRAKWVAVSAARLAAHDKPPY